MDWNTIALAIKNFFADNVWNIVLFFAALFIGIAVIKITVNVIKRLFAKSKIEPIAQQFIITTVRVVLYLILVLVLLGIIGVQITGFITALSALILAIGMALQNNIANLANGIVIVATKMFKKGDYIFTDGVEGSIVDINFLFTTITTTDNKKVTIPNSTIVNSSVSNAGANAKRRVEIYFSVAYESDVELVKKIVVDVMTSNGKVYLDPPPFCRLRVLGASSLDFFSYCWCDNEDYWDVYYYVIENVYNELKRNDISVPFTQLEVRNRTDTVTLPFSPEPLPARVEKERKPEHKFDLENVGLSDILHKPKKRAEKNEPNDAPRTEKSNARDRV